MGFYSRIIFPRFLNWCMSNRILRPHRRSLLSLARGEVLEVGFGPGLNLPYYPKEIDGLIAVDRNPGMSALAEARVSQSPFRVERRVLNGEKLPMRDESFDTIVTTWTLCSINRVEEALREMHRVLRPGGRFLFIEHGFSPDERVRVWQDRLTPFHKIVADGCHLNRKINQLVQSQGFEIVELEQFYLEKSPKFLGYTYRGIATRTR
ncbi:MAG: class I SAM-dependent methyltransferase [Acidobacteriota bacterium]